MLPLARPPDWISSTTRKISRPHFPPPSVDNPHRNGVAIKPRPFRCRLTPRSEETRLTIEREGLQALENLERFGSGPND